MKTLYNSSLGIEYGQFYITPVADDFEEEDDLIPDNAFEEQENGLCGAALRERIFFVVGIQNGKIAVDVQLHDSSPEVNDSFEEIVEVSIIRAEHKLHLCEWGWVNTHELDIPAGTYRLRYSIDGFENDYDPDIEDEEYWESPLPRQKHLIQIWPSGASEDRILKQTTEQAKYWHEEYGERGAES